MEAVKESYLENSGNESTQLNGCLKQRNALSMPKRCIAVNEPQEERRRFSLNENLKKIIKAISELLTEARPDRLRPPGAKGREHYRDSYPNLFYK